MLSYDVISYLVAELGVTALGTSADGEAEYHFDRPFRFVLTDVDAARIALFAPLDLPETISRDRIYRRLLEANLQGVETGQGCMCLSETGELGYRDVLDLREMSLEQVQLRFVDFSLYFEFWRGEGTRILRDELGQDTLPDPGHLRL